MIRYRDRNVNVIKKLKDTLSKNNLNAIIASEHNLTDDLYNPIACLLCCSRGIAVFDKIETGQIFNPNVAYELGMMHLLGRECIIFKHKTLKSLHTDILMKLYREYNTAKDVISHIKKWI